MPTVQTYVNRLQRLHGKNLHNLITLISDTEDKVIVESGFALIRYIILRNTRLQSSSVDTITSITQSLFLMWSNGTLYTVSKAKRRTIAGTKKLLDKSKRK